MPGAAETAKLISSLELKDKFTGPANKASSSLTKLDRGFARSSRGLGQLSSGVTRAGALIGGAVVAGLGASAKAAIDWEDAFTGVRKTLEATPEQLDALALSIRKMSTEMPNSAVELAAIAEAGGAMGIHAKDIEAFTKQVAILASTTNVSADEAAVALGQLQNVIGLTGDEFDNFAASLVALGNAGNSTESQILEIARRAGGAAKLFGIAKDRTLGWAAAAANLGIQQEAAGTALQNIFVKLMPKIQGGAKQLRDVFGKSGDEIKKMFKRDAGGALELFFKKLGQVKSGAERLKLAQSLFGKGSAITRTVLGLAESYDKNLAPSLRKAKEEWDRARAAQEEFDKRNATVKSAILRLKNTVLDAAVTIGEGFAPALGRAADKLAKFLSSGENRDFLKSIGEDIGEAIDGIDWESVIRGAKEFVGYLKMAFDWAKRFYDIFAALPTEVKAAAASFLVLNKLSGGLIGAGVGNIVGGLGESLIRGLGSMIPGVGRAFAQPVFVTNWPMGGLGGGGVPGAAGGLGALSKVFLVGEAIGLAVAVNQVREEISTASTKQATALESQTQSFIASQPPISALENGLAGVEKGISDLKSNPLHVLVQGDALQKLESMRASLKAQIADRTTTTAVEGRKGNVFGPQGLGGPTTGQREIEKVQTAVESMKGKMADDIAASTKATNDVQTAVEATKAKVAAEVSSGATSIGGATRAAAATVAGAVRASTPTVITDVKVYVTGAEVAKEQHVRTRYGPSGGSYANGGNIREGAD